MEEKKSFGFIEALLAAVLSFLWIQGIEAGQSTAAYKSSLEYRARARWQQGDSRGAREDLALLIREDTSWEVQAPELLEPFRELQEQLTGWLEVRSSPPGAQVLVDGKYVGDTNLDPPVRLLAGTKMLQLILNCYQPLIREQFRVEPGRVNPFPAIGESVELERIAATYKVATQPSDVQVWADGEPIARTSGIIPPHLGVRMQTPFDRTKVSDVLEFCLTPGSHLLEFSKDCYQTSRAPTEELELRSYDAKLFGLKESRGTIAISGASRGARVFLDAVHRGDVRPDGTFAIDGVCSGNRVLEIKHDWGKCKSDVAVSAGQILDAVCPLRPNIMFLGVKADAGVRLKLLKGIETKLLEKIRNQDRYYIVSTEELGGPLNPSVQDLLLREPSTVQNERLRELGEEIGEKYEVQALLAASVPRQDLVKDIEVRLLAVGSASPDLIPINYIQGLPDFVARLTEPLSLFGTRIGIDVVDTLSGGETPVVLYVHRESPAAAAGIAPGDKLAKADGETLKNAHQLFRIIQQKNPGDSLDLEVLRRGASFHRGVKLGRTPLEVPTTAEGFLYNKAIVQLRHQALLEPEVAPLAKLNLALSFMGLGDCVTALTEYLGELELPGKLGLSAGTVNYYRGLCYSRLSNTQTEAVEFFKLAMGFPDATLESDDGPLVAPLAEQWLSLIQ